MMVFYSAANPELNRVIVGGRNLSDAYVFKKAPNYSKFKKIIQYSPASYLPTEDIEMEIQDAVLARRIKAQFDAFWNRSDLNMSFDNSTLTLPLASLAAAKADFYATTTQDAVYARHLFSVPFLQPKDSNIEGLFVQMLDSAQKSVWITTPYFHLTKKLEQAMRNAHTRGVQITVLTNTDMSGDDFAPSAVTNANRSGIRTLAKDITIRSWDTPEIMLHAKMMLIDDDLLYVGSINLNMRSFVHDNENGVLLTGKPIIDRYKDLFMNYYFPHTHVVDPKELKPGLKATPINILLYLIDDLF
jgi:phosphatidylserine/phosphatidylglycerophosphate/cardiolipin synthase-like enzyme